MSRKPLIAANWKMYKTPAQAEEFVKALLPLVANQTRAEIVLCPSATSLATVVAAVKDSGIAVGGQNMHYRGRGRLYRRDVSTDVEGRGRDARHHRPLGARQYFDETDEMVNQKILSAVKHNLTPIICIGETLEEREAGKTEEVLMRQCQKGAQGRGPGERRELRDGLRAGLGDRHRSHGDARDGRPGSLPYPQPGGTPVGTQGSRRHPHSLRRQREAGQRVGAGQSAGDRRRTGRRGQPRPVSFSKIVHY